MHYLFICALFIYLFICIIYLFHRQECDLERKEINVWDIIMPNSSQQQCVSYRAQFLLSYTLIGEKKTFISLSL